MGLPQTPSSHPYSPSPQLKLYQAFIVSVPILFTVILFLLFYLFQLKRRRPNNLSSPQFHPTTPIQSAILLTLAFEVGLKTELNEKLPTITFEEEFKERDPQCCVCLGDFEIKEKLHQIQCCKHIFHVDCISHWLMANTTCPLCQASILTAEKRSTHLI